MVGLFIKEKRAPALRIPSTGVIIPYLSIQVSPPGYPQIGEYWMVSVFIVNSSSSSRTLTYEPALNSTVVITLSLKGQKVTYELPVDENGKTSFQYRSEYRDIAFQAYHPNLSPTQKIVLSINYVPTSIVDSLLMYNFFSILGSLGSSLLFRMKKGSALKWARLERWLLIFTICLFSFVTVISLYSKLFQETVWGYPENIVNGFVTFTLLRHIFFLSVVIFITYWISKLIIFGIHKVKKD